VHISVLENKSEYDGAPWSLLSDLERVEKSNTDILRNTKIVSLTVLVTDFLNSIILRKLMSLCNC
jgi:hypothetical protein